MVRGTFPKVWSDSEILDLLARGEGSDSRKPSLVEIKAAEDELLERHKDRSDSELVFLSQSAGPENQKLGLDEIKVAEAVLQARYRDWSESELVVLAQSEDPRAQDAKGVMLVRYGGMIWKLLKKSLPKDLKDHRECLRPQIITALITAISQCDPSKLTHKGMFGAYASGFCKKAMCEWHDVHFGLNSLLAWSRKPAAVERMIEERTQEESEKTGEYFKDVRDRVKADMSHSRSRWRDSDEEFKQAYEGYEDPRQRIPHDELVRSEFLERWSVIKARLSDDDRAFLDWLEQGVSKAQIARNLGVSKQYVGKMEKKLFGKVRQDRILADLAA